MSPSQTVFELADGIQTEASPDLLGLWTPVPSPPTRGIAFGTPGESAESTPVWRVNLPADPEQADAALAGAEGSLADGQAALTAAEERIETLVQRRTGPVAFGTRSIAEPLDLPEQSLLDLLQEAETGRPSVSFAARGIGQAGWSDAVEEFRTFMARVGQIFSQYAWVETQIEGQLLVRTTVSWLGDLDTAWKDDLDPSQMALHQRSLTMALTSRKLMLRSLIVAATGASKLSVLLSAPGGVLLALPAAWKFIHQIRAELDKYNQIKEAIENGK